MTTYTSSLGTIFPVTADGSSAVTGDIAALDNGNWVTASWSPLKVDGRVYRPDGSVATTFTAAEGAQQYSNVTVVGTQNGGFAVAYTAFEGRDVNSFVQTFNVDGTPIGERQQFFALDPDEPLVLGMGVADNAIVVGYVENRTRYLQSFSPSLTPITPAVELSSGSEMRFLPDGQGGLWMTFGTSSGTMTAQRIDSNGQTQGDPFVLPGIFGNVSLLTLGNGKLLAFGGGGSIRGRLLEPDGTPIGDVFTISTTNRDVRAVGAPTPDGGAVIAWSTLGDSSDAFAQRIGPDGSLVGDLILANTTPETEDFPIRQNTVRVDALTSGDIIIGWNTTFTEPGFSTRFFAETQYFFTELSESGPRLIGTQGPDLLEPEGAVGTLVLAGDGNDEVTGTPGDDTVNAGAGNDSVAGGAGNDVLNGGAGDDTLAGGDNFDTISGGDGNDVVFGGNGRDLVFLNQGNDVFNDNSQGGELGIDTVFGGFGEDRIEGGNGNDVLHGEWGSDTINGRLGNDQIFGGDQADTISAGEGNDTVFGGNGPDLIFLNQGNDLYNDNGQAGPLGNDTVWTGLGDDTVEGDNGNDVFYGEDGNDLINGRLGNDLIFGGANFDTISAGEGADTVFGGNGRDLVFLNQGNDLFNDNTQGGPLGNDTVFAGLGNDTIEGGAGNDQFFGEDGADAIFARLGNDTVGGGAGNDTIGGGGGSDTLTGASGADTFLFSAADVPSGRDLITDFNLGEDIFRLSGANPGNVTISYNGIANEVTVGVNGAEAALLRSASDLTGFGFDDILFT